MSLSEDIKDFALDLGYSKAGITTADSFPEYIAELKSRYEMYSFYIERPTKPLKGAEPTSVMPSAKSIVAVAYDAFKEAFPEKLGGKIGRVYQARCYQPPPPPHQRSTTRIVAGVSGEKWMSGGPHPKGP